ncbi:hypothetical protein V1525DRAFT_412722 [Lipomyces kononenkoae]|uniref:Uncharacterized protein n=1 Tax=Lipomyces kononenkoae TaxID=34357 RepID=A0ACC3STX1_LIPKO
MTPGVPNIVRCVLEPGHFQRLYRIVVNRLALNANFDFRTLSSFMARRHSLTSNTPPQSTSPECPSPRPWGATCTAWPSALADPGPPPRAHQAVIGTQGGPQQQKTRSGAYPNHGQVPSTHLSE